MTDSNANTSGLAPTDALRLVPVEPTEAMLQAGWQKTTPRSIYAAMLAAAPASPLPGGGWRTDFENAPKDGSVFMVGYDDEVAKKAGLFENKDRVYEARWNDVQSTWSARNGFILHSDATHWMPLPAAPTDLARNGKGEG